MLTGKKIIFFLSTFLLISLSSFDTVNQRKAEIVFCIDLSASTNGLVNDIRDNLWYFVNSAQKSMPGADIRIGIVGFGRPGFKKENDYVKILCDITSNYDEVSYSLFNVRTSVEKGDNCTSSALFVALKNVSWSSDKSTNKMIYVFGNGGVSNCGDYRNICEFAAKKNIPINSVYCISKNIQSRDLPGWNNLASITGGKSYTFNITKRSPLTTFSSDSHWLNELNNKLNDTYIYYSKEGKVAYDLMCSADQNSKIMSEQFFYSRCRYKTSSHYINQCREWDLVNLSETPKKDYLNFNHEYLPENLQKLNNEELQKIIDKKKYHRKIYMDQLRSTFTSLDQDTIFANPMDSIFTSGMNIPE